MPNRLHSCFAAGTEFHCSGERGQVPATVAEAGMAGLTGNDGTSLRNRAGEVAVSMSGGIHESAK